MLEAPTNMLEEQIYEEIKKVGRSRNRNFRRRTWTHL